MTELESSFVADLPERIGVLIVGAGVSGIGAACHLQKHMPDQDFLIVDAMPGYGGTWWTHRYPGARSDSDLHTYGYKFKPWLGKTLATSSEILKYLGEVIEDQDLEPRIRYGWRVTSADWSSDTNSWSVELTRSDGGDTRQISTPFLLLCQGYYDHEKGYTPEWRGMSDFEGTIIHPQHWPDDLDYAGKRVVVIGSGATAATLIPAMAEDAAHITMLQRSPTFFAALPSKHPLAEQLRALDIPDEWFHEIMRRTHIQESGAIAKLAESNPDEARKMLIDGIRPLLPEGFDVDRHFNPSYRPWQQRLAAVPDGDLFAAIRSGKASVVTDKIAKFTAEGIALESGDVLEADIIITATGFNLNVFGGTSFSLDGEPVNFPDHVTYRGMMVSGIPNMAYMFGYLRASWTLRSDFVGDFVGALLSHLRDQQFSKVVPTLRPEDADMERQPWTRSENFNAGYMLRRQHLLFGQGDREPWLHLHEYADECDTLGQLRLDDNALVFN